MAIWQDVLAHVAVDAERQFDALKYRLGYMLGGPDPLKIVPYRGYGTREKLYLKGRVLEDRGIAPANVNDTVWENLINIYRRLESDEVPHARLVARFQGQQQEVVANEEGFFEVWIEPPHSLPAGQLWHTVDLELVEPRARKQEGPVRATGQVMVPQPSAQFIVISDIDDTIIQSNVVSLMAMARQVFLGNAYSRLPFPGVAAFYRALYQGTAAQRRAANPLLYVSSSPWNLYDLLVQFFHLHDIPAGPILFLRDWGVSDEELLPVHNRRHKLRTIRQMVDLYAELPVILIGDATQQDPEIYTEIVNQYSTRILAVYIRNAHSDLKRPEEIKALAAKVIEAGSTLILADDTLAMARHAAEQGWIAPETLAAIAADKEKDEAPPSPMERLLGQEEEAPTVKVEGEMRRETEREIERGAVESALEAGNSRTRGTPTVVVESNRKKRKNQT